MKKNIWAKIFAVVALLWIIVWIIGTGALFLFQSNSNYGDEAINLTPEQIEELVKLQEENGTGAIDENAILEVLGTTEEWVEVLSTEDTTEIDPVEEIVIDETQE